MYQTFVTMNEDGKIILPETLKEKVKGKMFKLELKDDGTIILKPLPAGKFEGIISYESFEELEERQEKYVKKHRGV